MTISNFTDRFAPTTATANEPLSEQDATNQPDKDFAALLAASYAPLPVHADIAAPMVRAMNSGAMLSPLEAHATEARSGKSALPPELLLPLAPQTTATVALKSAVPATAATTPRLATPQAELPSVKANEIRPDTIPQVATAAPSPAGLTAAAAVEPTVQSIVKAPANLAHVSAVVVRDNHLPASFRVDVSDGNSNEIPVLNQGRDTGEVVAASRSFVSSADVQKEVGQTILQMAAKPEISQASNHNVASETVPAAFDQTPPKPEAETTSSKLPQQAMRSPAPPAAGLAEFNRSGQIVIHQSPSVARVTPERMTATFTLAPSPFMSTTPQPNAEPVKLAARVVQTLIAEQATELATPVATPTPVSHNIPEQVDRSSVVAAMTASNAGLPLPQTKAPLALPTNDRIMQAAEWPMEAPSENFNPALPQRQAEVKEITLKARSNPVFTGVPSTTPFPTRAEALANQPLPALSGLPEQSEAPELRSARAAPTLGREPMALPTHSAKLPGLESVERMPITPGAEGKPPVESQSRPQSLPTQTPTQTALALQPESSAMQPLNGEIAEDSGVIFVPQPLSANTQQTRAANASNAQPIVNQTLQPLLAFAQGVQPHETQSLRLSLNPAELGRVEVEVSRDAEGRVSASLLVEQADTAQALTHGIGQLRETLERAGLVVERLHIGASPQFQSNTNQPSSQQQHPHQTHSTGADYPSLDQAVAEGIADAPENRLLSMRA